MAERFPVSSYGTEMLGGGMAFTGKHFFVDPVSGSDQNRGNKPNRALATLYKAHSLMTAGKNDVCFLIGNGAASGTARLSLALAQGVDSSVTAGTLVWSKNACHLVGIAAPSSFAARARIAPPTGTYTVTTFGSANFITVSGSGCYFANISTFNGFSTGGAAQICWTDTGSRNVYENVHFGGMGDDGSAQDAGSRSLKIGSGGSGENLFVRCTIGLDTVTRTAANASLEFAGATPRNRFIECLFPFMTSAATPLGIIGTGTGNMDRFQYFERCVFACAVESTATIMSGLATMAASSGGGLIFAYSSLVGITEWGTDATTRAQIHVDGGTVTAATTGVAVNPT
jgi:hypothetical protein